MQFKYMQIYLPTGQKWEREFNEHHIKHLHKHHFKHPTQWVNEWNRLAALNSNQPDWFYYIP